MLAPLSFSLTANGAKKGDQEAGLSNLSVQQQLEKKGGGFSDLFVKLQDNPVFLRLAKKHGLDDPAVWPTLRKRFVLNYADLRGKLSEAESMIAAKDTRSGLSGEVMSAEKTREAGRRLRDRVTAQMDELQQMLRLIDEMDAVLEKVSRDHALTDMIRIENKAGQSFQGQVLLVDGNDLIVKRGEDGYFRVPATLLSEGTRLRVMDAIVTAWDELPRIVEDEGEGEESDEGEESEKSDQLIAYNESTFYFKGNSGGIVREPRSDSDFTFVPYEAQLESAREAESDEAKKQDSDEEKMKELEEAIRLNQSRLETIEWYRSRLGLAQPEAELKWGRLERIQP